MAAFHVIAGTTDAPAYPDIRRIDMADVLDCLRCGLDDFWTKPSHYAFVALIYPACGLVFAYWSAGHNALPLLYPLMSGFALVGPFAAIGLYEMSRRRELGLDTSWRHAFEVWRSPARYSIAAVGLLLAVIFLVWLYAARALYGTVFDMAVPLSFGTFLHDIFLTREGWLLIILGNAVGFAFAVIALATTVVAFPLLLDRDVGAYVAVHASVRAFLRNPVVVLTWGLIVAAGLALGSLPLFAGLAIVIPVLGHATWHLYRRIVG